MKQLRVVLLLLAVGFSSTLPATPKCPNLFYPNSFKGGLQTTQKHHSEKVGVIGVEGNYEYYLQFIRYKLDFKKSQDSEQVNKNILISPVCVLADTSEVC